MPTLFFDRDFIGTMYTDGTVETGVNGCLGLLSNCDDHFPCAAPYNSKQGTWYLCWDICISSAASNIKLDVSVVWHCQLTKILKLLSNSGDSSPYCVSSPLTLGRHSAFSLRSDTAVYKDTFIFCCILNTSSLSSFTCADASSNPILVSNYWIVMVN